MTVPKKMLAFIDKFGALDKARSPRTQAGAGTRLSKNHRSAPAFWIPLLLIENKK